MVSVAALLLAGCATGPTTVPDVVWPDPPEKPRIKLAKAISSKDDLSLPSLVEVLTGLEPRRAVYQPMGMAVSEDGKRLYVADFVWNSVFVFDFGRDELRFIGTSERFPLLAPLGVALDRQENVYVTDSWNKVVQVYDKDGQFLRRIGKDVLVKPAGVALDKVRQRLYVVDTGYNNWDGPAHRVKVFDLEGKLIREIGRRGLGDGEFNFPTYAALDSQGRLYVMDTVNARVQVFDPEGSYLWNLGRRGNRPGDFSRPKGLALDSFDNIYVADSAWGNVQIFNQKGELLLFFAGMGTAPGLLLGPGGITISKDNTIYVADSFGRRVNVYRLVNTMAEDSFQTPPVEAKGGEGKEKGTEEIISPKGKEVKKR